MFEQETVSFNSISAGSTRRVAATCFLEILQLKTWDLIDVTQSEPFGDIQINSMVCNELSQLTNYPCIRTTFIVFIFLNRETWSMLKAA